MILMGDGVSAGYVRGQRVMVIVNVVKLMIWIVMIT